MKLKSTLTMTAAGLFASSVASAAAVTSGEFVLDFNESTLSGLSAQPQLDRWFDGNDSADKTEEDMRTNPAYATTNAAPGSLTFSVLGSGTPAAAGLQGRNPQASTYNFTDSSNPSAGSGVIGLGGVYTLSNTNGEASAGDFGLAPDGVDWVLTNNVGFAVDAFTLGNVTATAVDDDNFTLSGDVFFTAANAGFTGGPGTSADTDIGDFSFTTLLAAVPPSTPTPDPEPTPDPDPQPTPDPDPQPTPDPDPQPTPDPDPQPTPDPDPQPTPDPDPQPTPDPDPQPTPDPDPQPTPDPDPQPTPDPTPEPPITLPDNPVTTPGGGAGGPVAAVPVPAAVWLFGSGLIGLISRRKKGIAIK